MDFKKIAAGPEYDFLRTHPRLGERIILLGLGGSHAYGTSQEGSDIDFRGVTLNLPSDLLGMTQFEQYTHEHTDTVIYSFNKIIRLLLECNPNTIELLGLEEDQYLIRKPLGQLLVDNRELFLSKRAIHSFGGYAGSQLRRLQNAIARDTMSQTEKERHILHSVQQSLADFEEKFNLKQRGQLRLYIDRAEDPKMETEIFLDAQLTHIPLRDYENTLSFFNNVIRDYDKVGHRNRKKDDLHLNKHAMHLIRLFMMAIDILEKGQIRTHRTDDLELLMQIRRGEFMTEQHTFRPEFYELVADYETRMEAAAKTTQLPDRPDLDRVEELMEYINAQAVQMAP